MYPSPHNRTYSVPRSDFSHPNHRLSVLLTRISSLHHFSPGQLFLETCRATDPHSSQGITRKATRSSEHQQCPPRIDTPLSRPCSCTTKRTGRPTMAIFSTVSRFSRFSFPLGVYCSHCSHTFSDLIQILLVRRLCTLILDFGYTSEYGIT